jgi:hypothetical protein
MRLSLIMIIMLLCIAFSAMAVTHSPVEKSCREHPQLIGKCFKLRGRLSVYNGAPALRIWRIGTKRVLGVSEQRFAVSGYLNVPEDVRNKIDQDKVLLGDFVVCPFTKSRAGEMQMVCIDKVTNLAVKTR